MKVIKGSKKELLYLIKKNGSMSVDQVVAEIHLAKTTVRQHLSELEEEAFLEKKYESGGRGRPSLHYQVSEKGDTLFPSSEVKLLRELIKFLKTNKLEEILNTFFEDYWNKRLKVIQNRIGADHIESVRNKAETRILLKELKKEGFMPEIKLDTDQHSFCIKECNCPFSEVVKETRLPCKLEANFYALLFNGEVERTEYLPDGDHSCTYIISPG
ncbi:MAG TPA: DeoR family transcriptional regulator [Massilibacterium sp.]|nr:DeoR family transcriptional regulator [Massilibacterium sp.]